MKYFLLSLIKFGSFFWRLIPGFLRVNLITTLFLFESRHSEPKKGLARLFLIKDKLDWVINERALAYSEGEHPKHRLTNYHYFFIDRINDGQKVIDVGCGYGAVARSIANYHKNSRVLGVDIDSNRLNEAQFKLNPPNLFFYQCDATVFLPEGFWDVVILSNVLEHILDRPNFLIKLQEKTKASRFLIRVPLFERDWQMAMRREVGVNYFSDPDHKIEHQISEFNDEISRANLRVVESMTLWGEIWANCVK